MTSPNSTEEKKAPTREEEQQAAPARHGLVLILLILASVLTFTYQLPFKLAAVGFAIAAIVWSVKYIVAVVKTKQRRNMSLGILGGLLSLYLIFSTMSSVILWPVQSKYEECLRDAITQQAQLSCTSEYQTGLGDWFKQITGQDLDIPGTN
ncbi:hypothetical protein [Brevibacterium oceani]|uniref:hypothetical protein n=1 Tax=Brevibacterium oceani TaxID=358099 RepID=UPI001B337236|nr:hypothetical protein [Brevibacterium oceani]